MTRTRLRWGTLVWAAAFLAPSAAPASAQILHGVILDDATGLPIEDVTVTLLNVSGRRFRPLLSNARGEFHFDLPSLGDYFLEAERIGYRTTRSPKFTVIKPDTTTVEFRLTAQAILMDPLVVDIAKLSGEEIFRRRMENHQGVLMGPAMVDSLRPEKHVGEILKHAEGVRVRWSWGNYENGSSGPIPYVNSYRGRNGCLFYIVDHTIVPEPWFLGVSQWGVSPLADLTPENLAAVEVYRHVTELPDDYVEQLDLQTGDERNRLRDLQWSTCGIVVFWTRWGWEGYSTRAAWERATSGGSG